MCHQNSLFSKSASEGKNFAFLLTDFAFWIEYLLGWCSIPINNESMQILIDWCGFAQHNPFAMYFNHCTEVCFASFLSGWFTTTAVINPLERKLTKRLSSCCAASFLQTKLNLFLNQTNLSITYVRLQGQCSGVLTYYSAIGLKKGCCPLFNISPLI